MTSPVEVGQTVGGATPLWQIILVAASLPGAAVIVGWVGKAWTWYFERVDKKADVDSDRELSARQKAFEEFKDKDLRIDARTEELIKRYLSIIDIQDKEATEDKEAVRSLEHQLNSERAECARGWDIARAHYGERQIYAREIISLQLQLKAFEARLAELGQLPPGVKPMFMVQISDPFPSLEAPSPRRYDDGARNA